MSIIEMNSGPITMRYLERKTKHDLARMYMDLLSVFERMQARAETAERDLTAARARIERLEKALREAKGDVCSLHCPSTWRTADGYPGHSERCKAITAALEPDHE